MFRLIDLSTFGANKFSIVKIFSAEFANLETLTLKYFLIKYGNREFLLGKFTVAKSHCPAFFYAAFLKD